MSQSFEVTGELIDSRLVKLDQPIPLAGGKVTVIVKEMVQQPARDLSAFEKALRERQAARNHVPRSKEEVDYYLDAERGSWDK